MSIVISPQTEARLTEEARRLGISVDALLERLVSEPAGTGGAASREAQELPVWHLGANGSFQRRDIYDDAD
jgi:hypothetical protein